MSTKKELIEIINDSIPIESSIIKELISESILECGLEELPISILQTIADKSLKFKVEIENNLYDED